MSALSTISAALVISFNPKYYEYYVFENLTVRSLELVLHRRISFAPCRAHDNPISPVDERYCRQACLHCPTLRGLDGSASPLLNFFLLHIIYRPIVKTVNITLIILLASEANALKIYVRFENLEFLKHSKANNNLFLQERIIIRKVYRLYAKLDLATFEVLKEINRVWAGRLSHLQASAR